MHLHVRDSELQEFYNIWYEADDLFITIINKINENFQEFYLEICIGFHKWQ